MTAAGGWRYPGDRTADLVALGILVIYGTTIRTPLYGGFDSAFVVSLLLEPLACLIAIGLRLLFQRLHFDAGLTPGTIGLVALLSMVGALCQAAIARLVLTAGGWAVSSLSVAQSWVLPFSYYTFVLLSWSLAHLWAAARLDAATDRQRAMVAETEALQSELQHLRHQLDPHFLFNALNGINAEIPVHPGRAGEMVRELADFLRYSLDHRDLRPVTLAAEIEAIRAYLKLQKARFGDDLDFLITVEPDVLARSTPGFLLQPLVENAIKHGFKFGQRPLVVDVAITFSDGCVVMRVVNCGRLLPDWRQSGAPGVGLAVLQRRLALHYPGRHAFSLDGSDDRVIAELKLTGAPCLT